VHALYDCTNRLLAQGGHGAVTLEKFREVYAIPFEQFYRGMGFDDAQVEKMMSLENNAFHEHYEPLADIAPLREGASEALAHAQQHGVNTLILSNHLEGPIRNQLKRHNIEHLFSGVIAYADRATQFKHMTKGEKLQRFMGENRLSGDIIIVGDTIEEIHIARDQGFVSVAITGGCSSEARLRAEKPHYLIHSLHELKHVMREKGFTA
jgi:phosphoglycolate phosphatase